MGDTSQKLNKLLETKQAIKQAIVNKGVEVADDTKFADYPSKISSIESGSGGGDPYYEDFYNLRTSNGTNMKSLFAYCTAPELDLRNLDVSNVTDMSRMFDNCSSSVNIDGWGTSKVINMTYMFYGFSGSIDISKLNFSSVTDIERIFSYANTDNIILTGLSFPKLTGFQNTFDTAKGTTLDLSSWDISNITSMNSMFNNASYKKINLTGWKTTNVTNMNRMFYKTSNPLEELIIPDWDMANASDNIFYKASYISNLKLIDLSRSNDATIIKIASFLPTRTATTFGTVLVPENTSQEAYDALVAKYWAPIGAAISPAPTSCSIVAELDEIMPGKSTKVYFGSCEPWNADPSKVELVLLSDSSIATMTEDNKVISTGVLGDIVIEARLIDTQEVIGTKTILVTETDSYPNLVKFRVTNPPISLSYNMITVNGYNKNLSALTYDSITDIYSYDAGVPITSIQFSGDSNISELIKLNTSNITDMSDMFRNCIKLISLDLSNFVTSQVINMSMMFYRCLSLTSLNLSNFDMSNVTDIGSMLESCNSLHTLRLDNCSNDTINKIINLSNLPKTAMDGVTRTIYCKEENAAGLTPPENWVFSYVTEEEPEVPVDPPTGDIPLYEYGQFTNNADITEVSTMVTSEHTDLSNMFGSCSNLTAVNGTDKWDTSNVTNMNGMFINCNKLAKLDVSTWNTSSLTTLDNTFCGCQSLTSLNVSSWDTDNVNVMYGLFYNCRSLTTLKGISDWNTSQVGNMADMFYGCESLTTLDLSGWDTSSAYTMANMFYGCSKLEELNLNGFKATNNTDVSNMFNGCNNLRILHLENCDVDTVVRLIEESGLSGNTYGGWIYVTNYPTGLNVPEGWTVQIVE